MEILITGAAGNLGTHLSNYLLDSSHQLRLLVHRKELPTRLSSHQNVRVYRGDLENIETLNEPCEGADCIIHLGGVLFAPWPERFLYRTNIDFVKNLVEVALSSGVEKFVLISFPHVEGESSPEQPALGLLTGNPSSIHARTRLAAEQHLFTVCKNATMEAVTLRSGMIYGRGVLMIEAGRWLMERRLLGVWRKKTWIHLLSLPDFFACVRSAIENPNISGIYNLGDDDPITLQEFVDRLASHWGYPSPWRAPGWLYYIAGGFTELMAALFGTKSPITRDFIRIGMASYVSKTTRMKDELVGELMYPSFVEGIELL